MLFSTLLTCAIAPVAVAAIAAPGPAGDGNVAVRAETIYTLEAGGPIKGGTLLIQDGRITALGTDVVVPPGTTVIDYGPGTSIVPGFVSAGSSYGRVVASRRTADPGLMAIDNFDPYSSYVSALRNGVTTCYLPPAQGRLIAGVGAVVSLAGAVGPERTLSTRAALHGSISRDARNAPGYWEPPIPATVDVGLGTAQPQLPRSTMGALVALRELVALARGQSQTEDYGPNTAAQLKALLAAGVPWRITANTETEIRGLLEFAKETKVPVVIAGGLEAALVADEIAAAGIPVIVQPWLTTRSGPSDHGKGQDARWPSFDAAARLVDAGARVAIAPPARASAADLLFAAGIASRGGLSSMNALRAITIEPARILGVDARVGSLKVGKDGDFVVLHGEPLTAGASVAASYVRGATAFSPDMVRAARKAHSESGGAAERSSSTAIVVSVDQLHVGDGEVLSPGEILLQDGKIVEVGTHVSRPAGAPVVRGTAAMPGMIDAMGFLGTEGSSRALPLKFDLSKIVEPGDFADRRVARSGVTSVQLTSRGQSAGGSPLMLYKPAADDMEAMVVSVSSGLRLKWEERTRSKAGNAVRSVLAKAKAYDEKWREYEGNLAKWTPPADEPEADADEDDESDAESDENGEEKDKKSKKKKKKKKKKDEPAKPITGVWKTTLPGPDGGAIFRLRLLDENGELEGSLRCPLLSTELIELTGERDDREVTLTGDCAGEHFELTATSDNEGKLSGKVTGPEGELEFEVSQVSKDYVVAKRPERRVPEEVKPPKGMPKAPGIDQNLEAFRMAFRGQIGVVVQVNREDEILACVDAFESFGIRPILFGGADAWRVIDQLVGRVSGVMLSHDIVASSARLGAEFRNRYAELQAAGVPVAFHSAAEEGAADLPVLAAYAVSKGMSPIGAMRALTSDVADMFHVGGRVGRLAVGLDADVLLLDGPPLAPSTSVTRVWVAGKEVR